MTDTFTLERYQQFAEHLQANCSTVLDVGCGNGRGGAHLKALRPNLTIRGLDCCEERLKALPPAYEACILGLSTDIPAADRSIDTIIAGEFLEHLYPADVDATLCEFQRILKIGGRLIMTTPNPGSYLNCILKRTVYQTGHLTQHHPKILATRLLVHGFNNVKLRGSGKSSRFIGQHFPLLGAYGSFLVRADKI